MTSRAVTSWIEALGTDVDARALDMVVDMARNERVVSLPPARVSRSRGWRERARDRNYLLKLQRCPI